MRLARLLGSLGRLMRVLGPAMLLLTTGFLSGGPHSVPAKAIVGASVTCAGVPATITGTSGDDPIRGTPRRDVIATFGGYDDIDGLGGNDLICSGAGNDHVLGGDGDDVMRDEGFGYANGGPGDDDIAGFQAAVGGDGNDLLRAGSVKRNVHFDGGSGDDRLRWGATCPLPMVRGRAFRRHGE